MAIGYGCFKKGCRECRTLVSNNLCTVGFIVKLRLGRVTSYFGVFVQAPHERGRFGGVTGVPRYRVPIILVLNKRCGSKVIASPGSRQFAFSRLTYISGYWGIVLHECL